MYLSKERRREKVTKKGVANDCVTRAITSGARQSPANVGAINYYLMYAARPCNR